jgi:hypothetical protein
MPRATNFSALNVGDRRTLSGSNITLIKKGTFTLDPASIATTAHGDQTVTVTGAAVGDLVMLIPPATLESTLVVGQARVTAANTVKFPLVNPTAGAVDGASLSWGYVLIRLS